LRRDGGRDRGYSCCRCLLWYFLGKATYLLTFCCSSKMGIVCLFTNTAMLDTCWERGPPPSYERCSGIYRSFSYADSTYHLTWRRNEWHLDVQKSSRGRIRDRRWSFLRLRSSELCKHLAKMEDFISVFRLTCFNHVRKMVMASLYWDCLVQYMLCHVDYSFNKHQSTKLHGRYLIRQGHPERLT
jgi:hypothetical protein